MAAAGMLLGKLVQQGGGLAQGMADAFGKWSGRIVLFIYMVWCQVLLTLRLRLSAQRLLGSGERDGAVWFFLGILGLVSLWMAHGNLGALGRTAQLLFTALGLTGGVVLVLPLFQVESENLLPSQTWSEIGIREFLRPGITVLGYGLFAAFLFRRENGVWQRRRWIGWMTGACLVLVTVQMIVVGRYGTQLAARVDSSFFQLAKSVGVEGAFQRVESIVAALWVFSDLLLLTGVLWCMRRIAGVLCPKILSETLVTIAVLAAMMAALALFGENISPRTAECILLPAGSVLLGLGIPVLAIFIKGSGQRK